MSILLSGLIFSANRDLSMDKWKDEIRRDWKLSKDMPRRMKKSVRKSLRLDWSLACSTFDFD